MGMLKVKHHLSFHIGYMHHSYTLTGILITYHVYNNVIRKYEAYCVVTDFSYARFIIVTPI